MEQQLIDALNKAESPDDIDDVSKAMITARITDALVKVHELTAQYLMNLEAVQKQHAFELKLGGLTVVLNVTDEVFKSSVPDAHNQICILGSRDKVLKNIAQITEKV